MKKVQNIVFVAPYTTKDGEQKKKYTTIGKCFTSEEGYQSLKFDFIPSNFGDGFINIMDIKEFETNKDIF